MSYSEHEDAKLHEVLRICYSDFEFWAYCLTMLFQETVTHSVPHGQGHPDFGFSEKAGVKSIRGPFVSR